MKMFFQIVGFRESNPQPQAPDPYSAQWAAVLLFVKTVKLASRTIDCTQLVMVELLNMFKTLLFTIVRKDISQAGGNPYRIPEGARSVNSVLVNHFVDQKGHYVRNLNSNKESLASDFKIKEYIKMLKTVVKKEDIGAFNKKQFEDIRL